MTSSRLRHHWRTVSAQGAPSWLSADADLLYRTWIAFGPRTSTRAARELGMAVRRVGRALDEVAAVDGIDRGPRVGRPDASGTRRQSDPSPRPTNTRPLFKPMPGSGQGVEPERGRLRLEAPRSLAIVLYVRRRPGDGDARRSSVRYRHRPAQRRREGTRRWQGRCSAASRRQCRAPGWSASRCSHSGTGQRR